MQPSKQSSQREKKIRKRGGAAATVLGTEPRHAGGPSSPSVAATTVLNFLCSSPLNNKNTTSIQA